MPDSNFDERLRTVVREQLLGWAKAIPDQHQAIIGTGSAGRSLSAKDIHEHVENLTIMGRDLIDTYAEMAVEKATEDLLRSRVVVPKSSETI